MKSILILIFVAFFFEAPAFTNADLELDHLKAVRLQQQGKYRGSDRIARKALSRAANTDRWRFVEVLTINHQLRGDRKQTRKGLEELLTIAPEREHAKYHFHMGVIEYELGQWEGALASFEQSEGLGYQSERLDFLIADVRVKLGRDDDMGHLAQATTSRNPGLRIDAGHRYAKKLISKGELRQGIRQLGRTRQWIEASNRKTRRQQEILDDQNQLLAQLQPSRFSSFARVGLSSETATQASYANARLFAVYNSSLSSPKYWSWLGRLEFRNRMDKETTGLSHLSVLNYVFDQYGEPSYGIQARPRYNSTSVAGASASSYEVPIGGYVDMNLGPQVLFTARAYYVLLGGDPGDGQHAELVAQWRRFSKTRYFNPSLSFTNYSKIKDRGRNGLKVSFLNYMYPTSDLALALGGGVQEISGVSQNNLTVLSFYSLQKQLRLVGELEFIDSTSSSNTIEFGALWIF